MTDNNASPSANTNNHNALLERIAQLEAENTALRAEQETMRQLVEVIEATTDLVGTINAQQKIVYTNRAGRRAFGFPEEGPLPDTEITIQHPEWALQRVQQGIAIAIHEGVWVGETALHIADGRTIPVSQVIVAHKNPDGEPVYFSTVMRDISAIKESERALALALERHRLHVEQTPLAIIEWTTDFHINSWNRAAEHIFGYTYEEALGQHGTFLLPPELEKPIVDGIWRDLMAQRGGTRSTNVNITKAGHTIMCEWYNTPLVDSNGTVIGVASMVQDVTAQHEVERQRIILQEQLIEAQQAALRELSTPLIPIAESVVIMPLVGAIDSARAGQVMETLLEGITAQQAEFAILDITGVKVVDTQVASALLRVAQAAKLLGARVILTGISAEVAQALVTLGADLAGITTHSNLQTAVAAVLRQK